MDMVIEKLTELGIVKFMPVTTDYTQNSRLKEDRIQAQIIEAAEQCERLGIPKLEKIQSLKDLLNNWPEGRFSNAEIEILRQCTFVKVISLGARILRAETAVCAVLSCYQAIAEGWRSERMS